MVTLEKARMEDLGICMDAIDAGRAFQREQGFVQWGDDYPNEESIADDIRSGGGRVLMQDGSVAGYLFLGFDGDPCYADIDGAWGSSGPYAVVHRMALLPAYRGRGLAQAAFSLVEKVCRERGVAAVRIDTDFPNKRMQASLERAGFTRRGVVRVRGGLRIAFDKLL